MMRFLYKINSGYDGFTPRRLVERLDTRGYLRLGWPQYLDAVERGAEVWVYFKGRHRFTPGVYVKGFVVQVERAKYALWLKPREYSDAMPLDAGGHDETIADAVSQRFRQVFFLPETVHPPLPQCTPTSCLARHCERCARWRRLPLLAANDYRPPRRLQGGPPVVPAYWVIPSRCYFHQEGRRLSRAVREGSDFFYSFKMGDERRAYPLALGIYHQLARDGEVEWDTIVPVPLSPDKIARKELHRTRALAAELARLLRARLVEALTLIEPISKKAFKSAGGTESQFERAYYQALRAEPLLEDARRILLVDDVCTEGATLRASWRRLREASPQSTFAMVAAGQMILKAVVLNETGLELAEVVKRA